MLAASIHPCCFSYRTGLAGGWTNRRVPDMSCRLPLSQPLPMLPSCGQGHGRPGKKKQQSAQLQLKSPAEPMRHINSGLQAASPDSRPLLLCVSARDNCVAPGIRTGDLNFHHCNLHFLQGSHSIVTNKVKRQSRKSQKLEQRTSQRLRNQWLKHSTPQIHR